MRQVLDPLTRIPGVRRALLIGTDGVPIAESAPAGDHAACAEDGADERDGSGDELAHDVDGFAGLTAGWLKDVARAVDPLAWSSPHRAVLCAARGTLIILEARGAMLVAILERGMNPDELRLPMEAAAARLERLLRRSEPVDGETVNDEPPGIFPSRPESPRIGATTNSSELAGKGVPRVSGEG